jgi:ribonucleoside-diphosphate reductase subunit M1
MSRLWVMQEKKPELDDDAAADDTKIAQMVCSLTNREECMACGS